MKRHPSGSLTDARIKQLIRATVLRTHPVRPSLQDLKDDGLEYVMRCKFSNNVTKALIFAGQTKVAEELAPRRWTPDLRRSAIRKVVAKFGELPTYSEAREIGLQAVYDHYAKAARKLKTFDEYGRVEKGLAQKLMLKDAGL
jgi:hypothetical protein